MPHAEAIKKAVAGTGTLVGTVGEITSGKQAQAILDAKSADAVIVGRAFLKDPDLVWHWADELDVDIHVASQCEFLSLTIYNPYIRLSRYLTFKLRSANSCSCAIDGWGFGMTRHHRHRRH